MLKARWRTLGSQEGAVPTVFLIVVIFWLTVTFVSPRNCVCSVSMTNSVDVPRPPLTSKLEPSALQSVVPQPYPPFAPT